MVTRRQWVQCIEKAWQAKPLVWLAGVRRAGKTVLCQSIPEVEYFDCELPRVRRLMEDPESFLRSLGGRRIALDEVHRLHNPSELLKLAADHFPEIRILATGSSTLSATVKFRDTLTGRKRDVRLTPMTLTDLEDFNARDLPHRFLRGGLPPFFLATEFPERDFQDWVDSYWAKDIQELYRLERRSSFVRFFELALAQSGGIFEASGFARPCEVSRTTVANYLEVLEATFAVYVVRPFSTHRPTEIVAAPKVYGFDTGFVAYFRGWHTLRPDDFGCLWEHFVLNELQAALQGQAVRYWRDKRGHEVDFVLQRHGAAPLAIECKWREDAFDPAGLLAFRRQYPEGENVVVAADTDRARSKTFGSVSVEFMGLSALAARLGSC